MLKLTWRKLNETEFVQAIVKLNNSDKLDSITAYRVGRICETAGKEMEKARKIEDTIRNKFLKKDENGQVFVNAETKQPEWLDDEAPKKYDAEFGKVLDENSVEIKVNKLDFNALKGLSGREMIALQDLIDNIPSNI